MTGAAGRLSVVGTPIGNLEDISRRAVRTLEEADVIYCEDTRRTRKLLSALGISAPRLVRVDAHNEAEVAPAVISALDGGARAALVTDAGMPTISDPGARLVAAVAAAGHRLEVVPGPSAVSAALALSGLPGPRYRFAGFLPRKGPERRAALAEAAASPVTVVIYEAAPRVARTVADLAGACGPDRTLVAAKELTKVHEEVWRGPIGEATGWLAGSGEPRGEWVLLIGPAPEAPVDAGAVENRINAALRERLAGGADRRSVIAEVAAEMGVPKRQVYTAALQLKDRTGSPPAVGREAGGAAGPGGVAGPGGAAGSGGPGGAAGPGGPGGANGDR